MAPAGLNAEHSMTAHAGRVLLVLEPRQWRRLVPALSTACLRTQGVCFWSWNANSGDTGGLIDGNQWTDIQWTKVNWLTGAIGLQPWYIGAQTATVVPSPPPKVAYHGLLALLSPLACRHNPSPAPCAAGPVLPAGMAGQPMRAPCSKRTAACGHSLVQVAGADRCCQCPRWACTALPLPGASLRTPWRTGCQLHWTCATCPPALACTSLPLPRCSSAQSATHPTVHRLGLTRCVRRAAGVPPAPHSQPPAAPPQLAPTPPGQPLTPTLPRARHCQVAAAQLHTAASQCQVRPSAAARRLPRPHQPAQPQAAPTPAQLAALPASGRHVAPAGCRSGCAGWPPSVNAPVCARLGHVLPFSSAQRCTAGASRR